MSARTFIFRTDASLDIGNGHVMRCLTLARALRARGGRCCFVCREHEGHLLGHVREEGFEAFGLSASASAKAQAESADSPALPHAAWLGENWRDDARQTLTVLDGLFADWLIVDHYAIDARWQGALRGACRRLMVIDDLADRAHDCDLLLDPNLGRTVHDYADRIPADCTALVGPRYALLRPEFAASRPSSLQRRADREPEQLLVTLGGVDKDNATSQVLEALLRCTLPADVRITVVMGPHAPWLQEVRALVESMKWPTEVRVNVADMAPLMAQSDLAIGAAGTTAWERCCLGLPSLVLVLAENQRKSAEALEAAGTVVRLESVARLAQELPEKLKRLWNRNVLHEMGIAASAVTDGQGAARVASMLLERCD